MTNIAPATTRTGNFPIGFRRVDSSWQRNIDDLIDWALANQLSVIDLAKQDAETDAAKIKAAGLKIGSVDLLDGEGHRTIISADSAARRRIIEATVAHIGRCAAAGANLFFTVAIPADKDLPPQENFRYFVESYCALAETLAQTDSRIVIEGWPGPGVVCCTPETYRAAFKEIGSERIGVNYDPSHLLRMGVDPFRFIKEFVGRVFHVHGKDTWWGQEDLYECGHELPGMFAPSHAWGGTSWRYTIPGHGQSPWVEILRVLRDANYAGYVSIELEDVNFNGTEEGEKAGFVRARQFLEVC